MGNIGLRQWSNEEVKRRWVVIAFVVGVANLSAHAAIDTYLRFLCATTECHAKAPSSWGVWAVSVILIAPQTLGQAMVGRFVMGLLDIIRARFGVAPPQATEPPPRHPDLPPPSADDPSAEGDGSR